MSKEALEDAKRAKNNAIKESAQDADILRIEQLVTGTAPEQVKKRNTAVVVGLIALVIIIVVVVVKKKGR